MGHHLECALAQAELERQHFEAEPGLVLVVRVRSIEVLRFWVVRVYTHQIQIAIARGPAKL